MKGQPEKLSNPFIWFDCPELIVEDPKGQPSNLVIKETDPFKVATKFELGGTFAPWIASLPVEYKIRYFYEGMGLAAEGELLPEVKGTTVPGKLLYGAPETTKEVKAGFLKPGLYKLTVVVSFEGNPPMTAFAEGPIIEIFP
jgi:hypothetical protein